MEEREVPAEYQRAPVVGRRGEDDWRSTRWFRITQPDGTLWMETSDWDEVKEESDKTGWAVERLWKKEKWEWRRV